MRPARGEYECKVCRRILRSPGALGGHMSQHARGTADRVRSDRPESLLGVAYPEPTVPPST